MTGNALEVQLRAIDYGVMAAYMLVLLALGLGLRKRAGTDMESYFLAGRKMPGWLNGCSYAATCLNADVAPAYCGMTVITGLFVCWWYFSRFGLALMIGGILFAVFWRRLSIMTSPEFYELRFGGAPAAAIRTWVAMRSAFVAVVAWTGAGLLGMQKIAQPLLGWDLWTTFAIVIPIILFYVLLSGYIGVVVSDFFQTLVIIGASLTLMWAVQVDFGGPSGLYEALVASFGPGVVSWYPPRHHELLGVLGVVAWTVGTAVGYGGDAAPMAGAMEGQRILSCRDSREAAKMYVWTQVILFLMLALLTLPALGAAVRWPGLRDGTIDKELAYGLLLGHYLPPGLLGLAISAILASIMSTVSSNMNFGAQVFLNDVYRRSLVPGASDRHYLFVGRIVAAVIVVLAMVVATSAQNVIDIAVFMLGLASAELPANWAQWWWWRFNGKARLAASFGGPLLLLFNQFVVFRYIIDAGSASVYLVVFASMGATTVLWVAVALLTQPEPEEKLLDFYRHARPIGAWGAIARKAGMSPTGWGPVVRGLGIAGCGAVMVGAGIVALSCAYVSRSSAAILALLVSLVAGAAFGRWFSPFIRDLQHQNDDRVM
ncbi:MAG: sodium:solute symporter family transporter [Vicinamibacteraceae bacterium]